MKRQTFLRWCSGAAVAVGLSACGGQEGPSKEDAVKGVEAYFTQQGQQATLQRSWRLEVKKSDGLKLDCEKKPNGDQACAVGGTIFALGYIDGKPTTPEDKPMELNFHMTFRPHGEGWEPVEVKDEGTSAG